MSPLAQGEINRLKDTPAGVPLTNTSGSESKQTGMQENGIGKTKASSPGEGQIARSANDFTYGKLLGLGSYSKVVQATLQSTGDEFALKVMDKLHIIRERKVLYVKLERCILDKMDHPGVVRCFFTFQDELSLYLGLECCHGGELFDQIKLRGRMSVDDARFYTAEIIDTLEYIHGQGVIHRDLKPENILLTAEGHVKLADFGSAKLLRPLDGLPSQLPQDERNSSFVGTAEYVSPEVLDSQPVTTGADIWALGCILFFMLAGKPPFQAASEYLCFQKVVARDFAMPDHFPPAARDLVDRLLDMVPERRLGAGPGGIPELKSHPFFDGVDWANLWTAAPPPLAPRPVSGSGSSGDEEVDSGDGADHDWEIAQLGGQFSRLSAQEPIKTGQLERDPGNASSCSASPPVPPTGSATDESCITDSASFHKWQRLLNPTEKLLATAQVKKCGKLTTRKRQLLLTDAPRLFYIDMTKIATLREIPWSEDLSVQVENSARFSISTPTRNYTFQGLKGQAAQWKEVIHKLLYKGSKCGGSE